MMTPQIYAWVEAEVERLFKAHPPVRGQICENPITGGRYFGGVDPVKPQKEIARKALLARHHFAIYGPSDAPGLPLSYGDRESLKIGGLSTLVAVYARSWEAMSYDLRGHPQFFPYACGALESEHMGYPGIKTNQELLARFPPKHLPGLGPRSVRRNDGDLRA